MGQKIHPTGFRLSVTRDWSSRWYASDKDFAGMLAEDNKVRVYLKKKLAHASVGKVLIERPAKNARVTVFSARPGVVIGKKGEEIDQLRSDLQKIMGVPVHVSIEEIRKPETDAQLIADSIAQQLEKAHHVPSRHEACNAERHASGCSRHQDHEFRSSERRRNCPYRMVSRRPCATTHPARQH